MLDVLIGTLAVFGTIAATVLFVWLFEKLT